MLNGMHFKRREILTALDNHFNVGTPTNLFNKLVEKAYEYNEKAGTSGYIIGFSGGVDSYVAAAILAATELPLTLVSLADGSQSDIKDVLDGFEAIKAINPNTKTIEFNIGALTMALEEIGKHRDINFDNFQMGNAAARFRMVAQYALANNQLVAGTDHATENIVGYFTKYGDGGVDVNIIGGLHKDTIYELAALTGAPESIMTKAPAAGLGITSNDEEELGMSYIEDIAPFLRGERIDEDKEHILIHKFKATNHKRIPVPSLLNETQEPEKITHVVIDCVGDFINGSLACENAESALDYIVRTINSHPTEPVLYVREMHPENHCSFVSQGGQWPAHCVVGTSGNEIDSCFNTLVKKSINKPLDHYNVFVKGLNPKKEEYSGFEAYNENYGSLSENCSRKVRISGIATEYCVKETAKRFLEEGYDVIIHEECLAYVNADDAIQALADLNDMGATIILGKSYEN